MPGAGPDRPVFVVGNPRSGTTLLASMLGRHPAVTSTPETLFLSEVQYQITPWLPHGPQAVAERLARSRAKHLGLETELVAGSLAALPQLTPRNVFATLLELHRQRQDKPRVLEKSPPHLRHVEQLLDWFPGARVLWIVRDGRACVASLLKVDWASSDPAVLAHQWRRNMRFGLAAEAAAGPRMLRLSYEALVADPRACMAPVFDFLGLGPHPAVFDHRIEAGTISPFEQDWKAKVTQPVDRARRDAWQSELAPADLQRAAAVMNPLLAQLGYAPTPLPPGARLAQALQRLQEHALLNPPAVRALRWAHRHRMLSRERRLAAGG